MLIFSGINACFASGFYRSDGIIHKLIDFKGVHELKVRHEKE